MNKFSTLCGALALASFSCAAQAREIRVVSGVEVDLTAVIEWHQLSATERKKVDRPKPHWKAMQISSIGAPIASYEECVVMNENKQSIKIYILHLPEEIKAPIVRLGQLNARIQALHQALNSLGPQADASSSLAVQRMAQIAQNNAVALRSELGNLEEERKMVSPKATAAMQEKVFAMFTGGTYGGLQIWDCGIIR